MGTDPPKHLLSWSCSSNTLGHAAYYYCHVLRAALQARASMMHKLAAILEACDQAYFWERVTKRTFGSMIQCTLSILVWKHVIECAV
jgi:hypothetical protein